MQSPISPSSRLVLTKTASGSSCDPLLLDKAQGYDYEGAKEVLPPCSPLRQMFDRNLSMDTFLGSQRDRDREKAEELQSRLREVDPEGDSASAIRQQLESLGLPTRRSLFNSSLVGGHRWGSASNLSSHGISTSSSSKLSQCISGASDPAESGPSMEEESTVAVAVLEDAVPFLPSSPVPPETLSPRDPSAPSSSVSQLPSSHPSRVHSSSSSHESRLSFRASTDSPLPPLFPPVAVAPPPPPSPASISSPSPFSYGTPFISVCSPAASEPSDGISSSSECIDLLKLADSSHQFLPSLSGSSYSPSSSSSSGTERSSDASARQREWHRLLVPSASSSQSSEISLLYSTPISLSVDSRRLPLPGSAGSASSGFLGFIRVLFLPHRPPQESNEDQSCGSIGLSFDGHLVICLLFDDGNDFVVTFPFDEVYSLPASRCSRELALLHARRHSIIAKISYVLWKRLNEEYNFRFSSNRSPHRLLTCRIRRDRQSSYLFPFHGRYCYRTNLVGSHSLLPPFSTPSSSSTSSSHSARSEPSIERIDLACHPSPPFCPPALPSRLTPRAPPSLEKIQTFARTRLLPPCHPQYRNKSWV